MSKKYDESEGVWRTIGGRKVFIKKGQGIEEAMKESGKFDSIRNKNAQRKVNKKVFTNNTKNDIIDNAKDIRDVNAEDVGKNVRKNIKEIDNKKYEDGTYDINTKKSVSFNDGYQATFQQLGDKYTDKEFGELVKKYSKMTDGKVYAGKFGGSPEVSFHFKNEKDAIEICEKFNQVSYWNWKTMDEVKNKKYKKGKGNDYA